jgi:YggT family protein
VTVLASISVADYVDALFVVYLILLLLNVLTSFIPRMPYYPWLRAVLDFITESTDPYLNLFRRVLKPVGGGGMAIDFSPMLAIIVLLLARGIVVDVILR